MFHYIYLFQNLNLGFILKIFLKFRKFQLRYSYKIYSYEEKRVYPPQQSKNLNLVPGLNLSKTWHKVPRVIYFPF